MSDFISEAARVSYYELRGDEAWYLRLYRRCADCVHLTELHHSDRDEWWCVIEDCPCVGDGLPPGDNEGGE